MRPINLTLAAAAALALLAAALWPAEQWPAEQWPTERPTAPATAAQPIAARSPAAPSTPAGPRATRLTYALEWQQTARLGDGDPLVFALDGEWVVTPRADGQTDVALRHPTLIGELPLTAADLEIPMALRADAAGTLDRIGFASEPPTFAHRILVGIAAGAWFTPGAGGSWTAVEADRAGRYEARYTREPDGAITRTRTGYLALHGDDGRLHTRGVADLAIEGQTRFTVDARGPKTIELAERLTSTARDGRPRAVVDMKLVLTRIDAESVARVAGAPLRFGPLKQRRAPADADRAFDRSRVGDATVPELVAGLSTATVEALTGEGRGPYLKQMGALAAALRLDPAQAAAIAAAARAADGNPAATAMLTGALGAAGTRESTRALADLLSDELDLDTRMQALANLGRSDYADPESVAAVRAQLDDDDLGRGAELALGAQANTLAETDPAAAAEAVGGLFDEYAAAETAAEKQALLDAMANSGDPRLLAVARAGLDDPQLAATAAYALRFVPGAEADGLLGEVLTSARGPAVWQSAVKAIGFRDLEAWRAPLNAALDRPAYDDDTRALIQRVLARDPG